LLTAMRMIDERPVEALDRMQRGHWEGDLIMGTGNRSAIGTLVERTTRYVILLHLPGGIGTADAVRHAITSALVALPGALRRTLTWDQGKELALHQQITARTGADVFFCDAHSPWQRGSNENMNGLLRDYFPKGTDLALIDADELRRVADELNDRPRKTATSAADGRHDQRTSPDRCRPPTHAHLRDAACLFDRRVATAARSEPVA
jgi:IS30 family transposase